VLISPYGEIFIFITLNCILIQAFNLINNITFENVSILYNLLYRI